MTLSFDDRDRESVLRDLESADEEVRRLAVERVDMLAPHEFVPLVVERLGDTSWRVRKVAVERLVASRDVDLAESALVSALADGENSGRRNSAVEALIELGARVVGRLIGALDSPDNDVRKLVVDSLAGIADPVSASVLTQLLLGDSDSNVRAAAADALGAVGGDAAVMALKTAAIAGNEDQLVRFSALRSLAGLEVPLRVREMASVLDDPILCPAGLDLLGYRDSNEAVAVLLKGLVATSRASREAAMRSLLRLLSQVDDSREQQLVAEIREAAASSESVVRGAVERLTESDLPGRLVLIQFLGLLGSRRAVIPILMQAKDEALSQVALATLENLGEVAEVELDAEWSRLDPTERYHAYQLFGCTRGERAASRLLAGLDEPDWEQRAVAARSLGALGRYDALVPLIHRLESAALEDEEEGEEEISAVTDALIALAKPRENADPDLGARAIELLASRLEGASEKIRLAIARILGCIGRPEDTELVAFLLKDPGDRVRRAAVDALARLEPGTASEPLRLALADESAGVRIAAARALGASKSDEVLDDLCRLTEDEDPRVRAAAVYATAVRFGTSSDEKQRAVALAVVDAGLRDECGVALTAVEALEKCSSDEASRAAVLLGRSESELLLAAIRCIGAHGDPEALLPLVSHADWPVRAEVIQVLASRSVAAAVPPILRCLDSEQDEFVRGVILRALKRLEA